MMKRRHEVKRSRRKFQAAGWVRLLRIVRKGELTYKWVVMRFLLYNVRYCTGIGRRFHFPFPCSGYFKRTHSVLEEVTAFVRSVKPDVVGLVEVDGGSFRSGCVNQAEYMAEALGHYHSFESKYGDKSWVRFLPVANKQMNAFLTSDVVQQERFLYFDHGVKRLVIQLDLEKLTVFLVHLSIKFRHRQHQLSDLYTLVKDVKKPYVIAGDFNVFWGDPEMELFLAATGLKSANIDDCPTYPSWAPKAELDLILYSPGIRVTHFELPKVTHSDHLPLICDFEVDSPQA
jgi:endonuclease/exonuclease/phosphatase family metal-dependent hydrolase